MSELSACPFCGGEAELKHNKTWDYFVRCKSCGVRTRQHHENHVGAEMDWNRRAERTCKPAPDWDTEVMNT